MLTCPVCRADYTTTGEHQPRMLTSCGHTFCHKCIDNTIAELGRQRCPQCSLVSDEPHAPNITIMGFVSSRETKPSVHPLPPPQATPCQDCKREKATLVCFQCLPGGFRFCDVCCKREHERNFGPVKEHTPKPIETVRVATPLPTCTLHPQKPCLFFSFKVNDFACEECRVVKNFVDDNYVTVDEAVASTREQVSSLSQLIQERVESITGTRTKLDELLGHVMQEKAHALDRVRVEFDQFEVAIKKRQTHVLSHVEQESQVQRKALLEQQEKLEIAQGHSDTALVRANWLIQMQDYKYLHQAEGIINHMKDQLTDREYSNIIYQIPITTGEIPVFIPPSFLDEIDKLGKVGGGGVPVKLNTSVECGQLLLEWEETDDNIKEYEVGYEPIEEEDDKFLMLTKGTQAHNLPKSISVKAPTTRKMVDGIMPGKKYLFRIRALNIAGWGVWSAPVVGEVPGFPLQIAYTGSIVEVEIPSKGLYCITAGGAKAMDGNTRKGGRGAIIEAKFYLNKYDRLIILCGGMSKKIESSSGGAGGTFVALNKRRDLLIAAGGGGGTRGHDAEDFDGKDANITDEFGQDGLGAQWAGGGAAGSAGKDAIFSGPSWGFGGAGFDCASSTANSFLHGGEPGEGGGFGGGGAVGHYGGGGGGGYSGGGGGRGGGGGGSFVREDGLDQRRSLGTEGHGYVSIARVDTE